eukprot:CAMPEP_0116825310 /NCGR_PEP_ID=MMETSP0418-20121206/1894_1 /TAXON_ID=1158023 /ORGANISM="Astrosyne radiata, Strain 13vi08-1A" /LENGTH=155 /DNA_ID=CAMNT_0004453803 /DNA_START=825 /DNA_END=1292 /DNA_ORIENTATION=+
MPIVGAPIDQEEQGDWETEDLPPLPSPKSTRNTIPKDPKGDDDDEYWKHTETQQLQAPTTMTKATAAKADSDTTRPLLLINLTALDSSMTPDSDPTVVSSWRKKLEKEYDAYAHDTQLLASNTVIPCGSSVWRTALASLRKENPHNVYCPIFPPK